MSQLALVDLAGSERTLRTGNAGDRLREAGQFNHVFLFVHFSYHLLSWCVRVCVWLSVRNLTTTLDVIRQRSLRVE